LQCFFSNYNALNQKSYDFLKNVLTNGKNKVIIKVRTKA